MKISYRTQIYLYFVITLLSVSLIIFQALDTSHNEDINNVQIIHHRMVNSDQMPKIETLQDHDPISINGNGDFHTQATSEGWTLGGERNGTRIAPYLLDNFLIKNSTEDTLISIQNTNVWFIISNIELDTGDSISVRIGINMTYVKNGVIRNSRFINFDNPSGTVIYSLFSSNIEVDGNLVYNDSNGPNTIWFDDSTDFVISNNYINQTDNGLVTTDSKFGSIFSNYINDSSNSGINLVRSSNIEVYNNFVNNSITGIRMFAFSNGKIQGNDVYFSPFRGMDLSSAFLNDVEWNNFYNNTQQIEDQISNGNHVEHNYYNEYISVDANNDSIFDVAYPTSALNEDESPLVNPHKLGNPLFTTTFSSNYFSYQSISLSWTEIIDNYQNKANYNLYFKHY